ncbi:UNVERIFIED_CONTAM: hypothetical protein GTU68_033970 [Idotea baltica]|nr:hypothetical protein [Idotea baltica]
MATTTDWNPVLRAEFAKPYWTELQAFLKVERSQHTIFPPEDQVFAALHLTPLSSVSVVILGQDPYHGAGQAEGLAFSVRPPVAPPPSLRNIFKELSADLGVEAPTHGSLVDWAEQGVLLLNTTLTVREGQAASHQGRGWEQFTDQVIRAVNEKQDPVVFVLWGAAARKKVALIDSRRHRIIEAPHPSPLSAHRGFFGSRPFSAINTELGDLQRKPVDWQLRNSYGVTKQK